jgi:hypothetical protein
MYDIDDKGDWAKFAAVQATVKIRGVGEGADGAESLSINGNIKCDPVWDDEGADERHLDVLLCP